MAGSGAVPGGIGGELPTIFREVDLTPLVILLSIATAFALGAGHALTPGHGKTLMAAYLVGTRGTAVHAVGLGLSVTVSHTLGILGLAALVVGAQGLLPPDVVVRAAPIIAAVTIVAIGGWMLIAEIRRRMAARGAHSHDGESAAGHDHPHHHEEHHEHGHDHPHPHVDAHGHDHGVTAHEAPGEHSHGGVRHSHLPPAGSTLSWRGLFALGLAGGLIPSTSALFILLGSIVAGRPAFGFVLVVVFGLGMAVVMTGVGLAMVFARDGWIASPRARPRDGSCATRRSSRPSSSWHSASISRPRRSAAVRSCDGGAHPSTPGSIGHSPHPRPRRPSATLLSPMQDLTARALDIGCPARSGVRRCPGRPAANGVNLRQVRPGGGRGVGRDRKGSGCASLSTAPGASRARAG